MVFYRNLSVAMKVALATMVAIVIFMVALTVFMSTYVARTLEAKAFNEMEQQTRLVVGQLEVFNSGLKTTAGTILSLLENKFPGDAVIDSQQAPAGEVSLPVLRIGSVVINNNHTELDRLSQVTGGVNTIMVRKGDDFYRIATSLKNDKGERVVGAPLGKEHPGTKALLKGEAFTGKAKSQLGADLLVKVSPIRDRAGQVIGAFGVSLDFTKSLVELKKEIGKVKIGETGYIYALDAKPGDKLGVLTIHPAKEGGKMLAVKDADGNEFVREMVERKNGQISYPWINKELGETSSRQKIAAFIEFPEWQWVVVGSSYIEEMTRESAHIRNNLLGATLLIVVVLALVIVKVVNRQVSAPLSSVVGLLQQVGNGNLHNRIDVRSHDEIGQLQTALATMQQSLLGLVNEIKEAVAQAARGDFTRQIDLAGKQGFGRDISETLNTLNRDLLAQLGGNPAEAVRVASAVAAGDLSVRVPVAAGDQHSILAAMAVMQQRLNAVIEEVRGCVNAAAQGDFSHRLDTGDKQGYAKTLAELLNTLSHNAHEGLSEISRVASALSEGDLTSRVNRDYPGLFGETARAINATSTNLRDLLSQVMDAVETINSAAGEIASGNRELSSRTEEQASSLEETAASMEQLTTMVRQNTDNAQRADQLAQNSSVIADKGGAVVSASVHTMEDIATSSRKISDIISVIDGIAFQTNILALNAAVEAARAGEQGRGFAVVASEVRNLALRAAGAAKEIKDLITESVEKVERGTQQAEDAGRTMGEIVGSIGQVSQIITEIANASGEQTSGIEQVNTAMAQMDRTTQQNAALVEQAAASAEMLEDQARQLQQSVARFRLS